MYDRRTDITCGELDGAGGDQIVVLRMGRLLVVFFDVADDLVLAEALLE